MKKIILASILAFSTLALSACGNMSVGPGNYQFNKCHIFNYGSEGTCVEIERWYDNENGIEVKIKNGSALYLSEGSYMLVESNCPFCNGGNK